MCLENNLHWIDPPFIEGSVYLSQHKSLKYLLIISSLDKSKLIKDIKLFSTYLVQFGYF